MKKIYVRLRATLEEVGKVLLSMLWRIFIGTLFIAPIVGISGWIAAYFPFVGPLPGGVCDGASPSFETIFPEGNGRDAHPLVPCAYAWQVMTYLAVFVGLAFFSINTNVLREWMGKKWLDGPKGLRSIYPGAGEKYDQIIWKLIDEFILRTSQYTSSVLPLLFVYFVILLLYPNRYIPWTELLLVLLLTVVPFFILYRFDGKIERKISIWHEADRDLPSSADAVIQRKPESDVSQD